MNQIQNDIEWAQLEIDKHKELGNIITAEHWQDELDRLNKLAAPKKIGGMIETRYGLDSNITLTDDTELGENILWIDMAGVLNQDRMNKDEWEAFKTAGDKLLGLGDVE